MSKNVNAALEVIHARAGDAPVRLGLILGSGLGHIAQMVDGPAIPYAELPDFPHIGVSGHNPHLHIGTLEGQRIAIFGAREHYYENGNSAAMRPALEVLRALGGETLLLTNAAGSLRPDVPPGEIMLIEDHINYNGKNPLIGEMHDARFVPMKNAYDPALRSALQHSAEAQDIDLQSGVYAWYSGPSFETPAEIRMLKTLGADAVGMSTVPEVILGRFMGLRCAAVSTITNMAAGLSDEAISHEHTKEMAPIGAIKLEKVLRHFLRSLR